MEIRPKLFDFLNIFKIKRYYYFDRSLTNILLIQES